MTFEEFMLPERADRLRQATLDRTRNLVVALDGVHDPHNLSAVVRSSDAFGLLDLHIIESQARFAIRSKVSQGCEKWLDIHRWPTPEECLNALKEDGFQVWVADPRADSRPVDDLPWSERLALVFGNEHEGPSKAMLDGADGTFHIPMYGFSQSFNISVAAAISLAVGVRERERRLGHHGDLPESERGPLAAEWHRRSVRAADLIAKRLEQSTTSDGGKS